MRLISVVLYVYVLFIGQVYAEGLSIPEGKSIITFESKTGNVTFAHRKHADLSAVECMTCHHNLETADNMIVPCHECHLHKSRNPLKAKKAFHKRCIGCHEYTVADGQAAGPVKKKCVLCHIRE